MLRHTDSSHQQGDVGISGCYLVSADEQRQGVHWPGLCGERLCPQGKRLRIIRLQLERAVERRVGPGVIAAAQKSLSQVVNNFKGSGRQRIGFFQFQLGDLILPGHGE